MSSSRGQTTLDFAIGVSLFLVVLVFVLTFVPTLLGPFVTSGTEDPALADRLVDRLAQGRLGSPETPYVLDTTCAVGFFNASSPSECRYDGAGPAEKLAVAEGTNVNVTLEGNASAGVTGSTLLCWDDDTELAQVGSGDCGDPDDVRLATGDTPPEANDATVTARRVVSLDDQDVTLEVVVW